MCIRFRTSVKSLAVPCHLAKAVGHREPIAIGRSQPIGLGNESFESHRLYVGDRATRIRREAPTENGTNVRVRGMCHHALFQATNGVDSLYVENPFPDLTG